MEVNNKNNGFTLIEILVVIVIIMILTLVALPYFMQAGKQFALSRSAHKLAQDIRMVQEMSMSAKEFHGIIPQGGYGVRFDENSNTYILFADCSNNKLYDSVGNLCNGYPEKVEEIKLERGVKVKCLFPVCWLFGEVVFTPPDPVVTIQPFPGAATLLIQISLDTDPSKTKTITVNKAGLIEIQ